MDEKLEYLELHITDSCNLNCKGCSHCAGLVAQGQHIPLESYKNDLKRLKEFIPEIRKLRLLGGEPFLNPEISEYVTWARKVYPDSDIRVVTNGLLCLKADKKIYQALRENQVMLDISCYPPTEKIKEKLEALFVQEGVAFRFSAPIEKFAKRVNLQGDSDAEAAFGIVTVSGAIF